MQRSVASVYFSNGSAVDIAKIQGGPAYKQLMRAPEVLASHVTAYHLSFDYALEANIGAVQASLGLQSLRDFLPPWLGGKDPHPDARS